MILNDTIHSITAAVSGAFTATLGPLHRTTLGARYSVLRTLQYREGMAAVVQGICDILHDCESDIPPNDVRVIVFRLYLARWLLKMPLIPEYRLEAQQILEEVQVLSPTNNFDKEAAVHLV
jgi:hypothetical protein